MKLTEKIESTVFQLYNFTVVFAIFVFTFILIFRVRFRAADVRACATFKLRDTPFSHATKNNLRLLRVSLEKFFTCIAK